jgi:hypothetical protein
MVEVMIILQQCGICLTYFIFVAHNLFDVATYFGFDISMRYCCCLYGLLDNIGAFLLNVNYRYWCIFTVN